MRLRKTMGVLLAAVISLTALPPAYGDSSKTEQQIDKNVQLTQGMFEDKRTIPLWLLEDLKQCPDKTISLETSELADNYRVSFTGSSVGELPDLPRLDLRVNRIREEKKIAEYYNAASKSTPKYLLELPQEGEFSCEADITMIKSSFMPGSTVHAYRYKGNNTYTPVEKNIMVEKDGSFTFPAVQGGIYLVTAREIEEKLPGTLNFDRPARNDVNKLLSFLNDGSVYDFSQAVNTRG